MDWGDSEIDLCVIVIVQSSKNVALKKNNSK